MFKHRLLTMQLEKELKQTKPFKNPYEKLGVNLMFTSNWLTSNLKEQFAAFGITPKQYNILRILNGAKKPVSTNFIRERLLDKMSDVSRLVDRLSKNGMVAKKSCANDKRLVDVVLTESGKELVLQINKKMSFIQALFSNLSDIEVNKLNELLNKLRQK